MPSVFSSLVLPEKGSSGAPCLGHRLVDDYLASVAARLRPNSTLAAAYDLKVFFTVTAKDPADVRPADIVAFVRAQRSQGTDGTVVRLVDGAAGLAVSTVRRRLSSVSSFYRHLVLVGEVGANPVQRGMPVRSPVTRSKRVVPLVRPVRHLPRVLDRGEVAALVAALRTQRDQAIVEAMLLAGLRRSEALGLRLEDVRWGERRLFIADGKGGHQRLVPMSKRFFGSVSTYMDRERPETSSTDRVFVALKGAKQGQPLGEDGLDKIIANAKGRAGLAHCSCHELRHTCLTRLREAGMALEAIQAQAGHRSLESTRLYLHLANDWLAAEYVKAAAIIDASRRAELEDVSQ
jgi:integrase/recombinase XerD